MKTKNLLLKLLLFLPIFTAVLFAFYQYKQWKYEKSHTVQNRQAGKKFELTSLYDSSGKNILPDFSKRDINIVDFWFRACPTCITEMKQFEIILKGKEDKIMVTSVSIDNAAAWKDILEGRNERWAFAAKPVSNWKHLNLRSGDTAGVESSYSLNANYLKAQLGVTSYPGVFVIDKNGIIKATPESAVAYIQTVFSSKNGFLVFLTAAQTWSSPKTWLLLVIAVILFNWVFNFLSGRKKTQALQ
ncbi:MAG: redoxin domain-containing protein [Ferruginibacter sp.]